VENRILTAKEIFKAVDKISRNDVLRAAKDIFRPENLNLALIGPFDKKEKFQTILNGF
jgi:predicted Zn-dependent peptidase